MRLQFPHLKKAFAFLAIIATLLGPWTNAVALEGNETVNIQAVTAFIEVDSAPALTSAISVVNANPGTEYIISIRDNIFMTSGTFAIRNTAGVTIMSDMSLADAPFTINRGAYSGMHFTVGGTLTLANIVLDGNFDISTYSGTRYGGVDVQGGKFYLNRGAIIQNCNCGGSESAKGGGISVNSGGGTIVDGGTIRNNKKTGTNGGGGVYVTGAGSSFTMIDGGISNNTATSNTTGYGGGIAATTSGSVTIKGGTISGNTAGISGGGVSAGSGATFNMTGGTISGNKSLSYTSTSSTEGAGTTYGGGVFSNTGTVTITGGTISGNTVVKGYGGGIGIYSTNAMSDAAINISGVTISGNTTSSYGGGIFVSLTNTASTTVSVIDGIISDNVAANGGGIYVASSNTARSVITVSNSEISANKATDPSYGSGGGIYGGAYSTIQINKSKISDNTASGYSTSYGGGGIFGNTNSSITVDDSKITGNSAGLVGGGIYGYNGGSITIIGGSIVERNEAVRNGGGIYGAASCYINVADSQITGNRAPNGDGGGIYTADTSYAHIISSGSAIYSDNLAKAAYLFAGTPYPDIRSASVSIPGTYVLNNYDINYTGGPLIITYTVTYDANGADGAPPVSTSYPAGAIVTVAGPKTLALTGYTFAGWKDSSGNHYTEGDTFIINGDVTLYAQWEKVAETVYTVTYDANGADGTPPASASYPAGAVVTVAGPKTLALTGYTFAGWKDIGGNHYAKGETFIINGDVILYAQWEKAAEAVYTLTYDANGANGMPPASASYLAGSAVTVAGPNTLSLTGYTFAGWNDGSGNPYAEGDTFTIDSDIVFYAQWNISNTGGINNNVPGNRIYGVPVTPNYLAIESNPGIIEIPEEMPPLVTNPVSPNPATGRSKHELFGVAGVCLILSSILLKINAIRKTKERE